MGAQGKPLKRLDLCNNCLVEPVALCQILQEGTYGLSSSNGLRQLVLTSNPITDVGFITLFDALLQLKISSSEKLRSPFEFEVDRDAPPGEPSASDREGMFQTIAEMGMNICIVKPGGDIHKDADVLLKL